MILQRSQTNAAEVVSKIKEKVQKVNSVLPQGDIKVFFTIKKNKAGSEDFEDKLDDLKYDLEDEVDEFLQFQFVLCMIEQSLH